jgi:quercetin dioxygenase-like cupin family protein
MTKDMAEMPVQHPAAAASTAAARARFFNSGNAFNKLAPPVPARIFTGEIALARATSVSGFIACDQAESLGGTQPATTPLMLARYAHVAEGQPLAARFRATGAIWYVIEGAGCTEDFAFAAGDVFLTTGEPGCRITADAGGALLWVVTNEPQLALDGSQPAALFAPVHYPAAEIAEQLGRVYAASRNAETSGMALIFCSAAMEASRNILPSLTLGLNAVPAGEQQPAHCHNAAALTLILAGERCYSMVGGARCDWSPFATLVTPAGVPHSHHNDSAARAQFLIVQDGGLHHHARTMDFRWEV